MFYFQTWMEATWLYSFCNYCIYNWVILDSCIHLCNYQPNKEENISITPESFFVPFQSTEQSVTSTHSPNSGCLFHDFDSSELIFTVLELHINGHRAYTPCISSFFCSKFLIFNLQLQVSDCFFLFLSSIALYEYTTIYFFHSIDAYLDYSQFWLLWIKLLWTSLHKSFLKKITSFIYSGCAGSSCWVGFSSFSKWKLLSSFGAQTFVVAHRLLGAWTSVIAAPGLYGTSSVVSAPGLSCFAACAGIKLMSPHWQADSLPLSHQGTPAHVSVDMF